MPNSLETNRVFGVAFVFFLLKKSHGKRYQVDASERNPNMLLHQFIYIYIYGTYDPIMHQFIYGRYDPIIYRAENTSTGGARFLTISIVSHRLRKSSITQNLEVFSEVKAALV